MQQLKPHQDKRLLIIGGKFDLSSYTNSFLNTVADRILPSDLVLQKDYNHPFLEFCSQIEIKIGSATDLWNFNKKFNPHRCKRVTKILFKSNGVSTTDFPDVKCITPVCSSLKKIVSEFPIDHPVSQFACELALLNGVRVRIG